MFKALAAIWDMIFKSVGVCNNFVDAADSLSRIAKEEAERLRVQFEIEGIARNEQIAKSLQS